ncbi:hypothetical protein [Actinacidiphila paucisporea]|nr:hypothetical protein [Actinacidiphila paucisporea]
MWPGEQQPGGQSGGQQNPSGNTPQQPQGPYGPPPNPYAQPGYQQPGYQQPGYGYPQPGQQPPAQPPGPPPAQQPYPPAQPYGQPSPYGQPGYQAPGPQPTGYPAPQNWGPPAPGGPDGGRPPGGRGKLTVGVAIGAALAVIAAVVVTVALVSGGGKKTDAQKTTAPPATATTPASPTATPTPTATGTQDPGATGGGDDPRGPQGATDVSPVIPGWQAVKRQERNSVFDVPPDWTLGSESMTVGFADDSGKPQVMVGAPAYYKEAACKSGDNEVADAGAGTKGGAGAASLQAAAENEARAWAKWAFQEKGKGTVSKALNSKAFHNAYGITGWQAQATTTAVPRTDKCASNGIAYAVAWLDPAQAKPTPVVWVLWARQGVPDQVTQAVIDRIKSSIRPMSK